MRNPKLDTKHGNGSSQYLCVCVCVCVYTEYPAPLQNKRISEKPLHLPFVSEEKVGDIE